MCYNVGHSLESLKNVYYKVLRIHVMENKLLVIATALGLVLTVGVLTTIYSQQALALGQLRSQGTGAAGAAGAAGAGGAGTPGQAVKSQGVSCPYRHKIC